MTRQNNALCTNCGYQNPGTARFCALCGGALGVPAVRPGGSRRWIYLGGCVVALILVAAVALAAVVWLRPLFERVAFTPPTWEPTREAVAPTKTPALTLAPSPTPTIEQAISPTITAEAVTGHETPDTFGWYGRPGHILYTVQEDEWYLFGASRIVSLDILSRRETEIAAGHLVVPDIWWSQARRFLSADGHRLIYMELVEGVETVQLRLVDVPSGYKLWLDEAFWPDMLLAGGFSPDSSLYAYTALDEMSETVNIRVIDSQGNVTVFGQNAIFLDFIPNSQKILIAEFDLDQSVSGLAWLDIDSLETGRILSTSLNSSLPQPFPNGSQIYHVDGGALLVIDIDGSVGRQVYKFDPTLHRHYAFLENGVLWVWLDGELMLVNPQSGHVTPISRDVVLVPGPLWHEIGPVVSADSNLLAYLVEEDNRQSLYVSSVDGRSWQRIFDSEGFVIFAFTPDSRQIVFLELQESAQTLKGDLYVSDVDGRNRLLLESDVWSFQFTPNVREVVYCKVLLLEGGRPRSEIISVQLDGQGRRRMVEAQPGLVTILAVTR